MNTRSGWVLAGLGLALFACLVGWRLGVPAEQYGDLSDDQVAHYVWLVGAAGLLYGAGVMLVRRWPVPHWAVLAGLGFGLAARLVMVVQPPVMSTDLYRYVWDGRVQAAGINPYRYIPADPVLAGLRDDRTGPEAVFINMNRPETAKTIYPPAAEMVFAAIGVLASSMWTMKVVMLGFDLLAGWASWRLLGAAERPLAWLLVWAWNPLAIMEFSGAGHIDAMAMAAGSLALLLAVRRRPGWAGAALGVAVLSKLLPAAIGPAIWRPRTWRAPAITLLVIAAGYAVYASVGWSVFGYLPGYAEEEGIEQGVAFWPLRLIAEVARLPSWAGVAYLVAALVLLDGLAAWVAFRRGPPLAGVVARDALILSVALLLVLSPHYPWYLTMVIVPAVVVPRLGALWVTIAAPLLYLDADLHSPWWPATVFLPAAVWLVIEISKRTDYA